MSMKHESDSKDNLSSHQNPLSSFGVCSGGTSGQTDIETLSVV